MFYINSIDVSAKEYICREYIMKVMNCGHPLSHGRGKEVVYAIMKVYPTIVDRDETTSDLLYAAALGCESDLPVEEIVATTLKGGALDALFNHIYNTEFVQNMVNSAQSVHVMAERDESGEIVPVIKTLQ